MQAGANRQYSSGGSVRITAANNPIVTILSRQLAAHGRVPIVLKTSADGSGSVMIQRVGQTGFDWYGVDLQ